MAEQIDDDDDWLEEEELECPSCKTELLIIEHSPLYHSYYIYCDSCPKRVDVSFYEKQFETIRKAVEIKSYEELLSKVCESIASCTCGGKYTWESPLRCHRCNTVIKSKVGFDIWPKWFFCDDDEFENYEEAASQFSNKYIVENGFWK